MCEGVVVLVLWEPDVMVVVRHGKVFNVSVNKDDLQILDKHIPGLVLEKSARPERTIHLELVAEVERGGITLLSTFV